MTRDRIGTIYQTVKPNGVASLSYPIIFLIRRSCFVFLTFYYFEQPVLAIQILIFLNVLYIIYINSVPTYDEPMVRNGDIFNESAFMIVCYHM